MSSGDPSDPEVFSVGDIAEAADVSAPAVCDLLSAAEIQALDGHVRFEDAVWSVRVLRGLERAASPRRLFAAPARAGRRDGTPLLVSGALHAAVIALALVFTGVGTPSAAEAPAAQEPARLVFIATPGPGGGGGGGGRRQPAPPSQAQLKGTRADRSAVIVGRRPEAQVREARNAPPPVPDVVRPDPESHLPDASPTPPVAAPVVSVAADTEDVAGDHPDSISAADSRGPGESDGIGSGSGGGTGPGDGIGLGNGSIAGAGGGPYRPGSGITPPSLQREVQPLYTEDARRRGIEGDVLLEVVVRSNGAVGDVRIVRGLGGGLDERAVAAVRQWLFAPARRHGTPVDVLVEVAVEFRLR